MVENRKLLIEVFIVVSLTVLVPILRAIARMVWLEPVSAWPFSYYFLVENLRALGIIVLVIFILWLKNEHWHEVGLVKPSWMGDIFLAWGLLLLVLLLVPVEAVLRLQFPILAWGETSAPFVKASGVTAYLWITASAILTGFAEELLARGYLISRLMRALNTWKAVLASSFIFAVWHFSQGISGIANTFVVGIIFGIAFSKTRTLCPLVIVHAARNIIACSVANMI